MDTRRELDVGDESAFVSTGDLPPADRVQALIVDAHRRYSSEDAGENSTVYPALQRVPRELFGICVVGTNGGTYAVGDAEHEFSIMSVAKPFVFALVCQSLDPAEVLRRIGVKCDRSALQLVGGDRAER